MITAAGRQNCRLGGDQALMATTDIITAV